jgi:tetratricopeptide (TPR) repeat protein
MNIELILAQYDAMFGKNSLEEIEEYLVKTIKEAKEQSEFGIVITLLNEIIGFCRDTTQKDKALQYCEELQEILKMLNLEGRIDYATSLLNVANAYRAFGLFKESLQLYGIVEETYQSQVAPTDFMYASLYNNWSLLYQELEQFSEAVEQLKKAIVVVDAHEEAVIEQATTRANLAVSLLRLYQEKCDEAFYDEAMIYIQEALAIHEQDGGGNFHYSAVLSAAGDACFMKEKYEEEFYTFLRIFLYDFITI